MEIIKNNKQVIDENNKETIKLHETVISEYLLVIDEIYEKLNIELDSQRSNEFVNIIAEEIKLEIKYHSKFNDIETWLNRESIIVVRKINEDRMYARIRSNDGKNYLIVNEQKDKRKYRENISSFLKDKFNIDINMRTYKITAIDNSQCYRVQICDKDILDNLLYSNIVIPDTIEDRKRFFMEPFLFNNSFLQGYGKTCPLCGKKIVTQITTMRIKKIQISEFIFEFLCCASCADLFEYCDKETNIKIGGEEVKLDNKTVILEKLKSIDCEIELEFYFEPEFIEKPYIIAFKPRAAHKYVLHKALNLCGKN